MTNCRAFTRHTPPSIFECVSIELHRKVAAVRQIVANETQN